MFPGGQLVDVHRDAEPMNDGWGWGGTAAMMHLCLSSLDEFNDEDPEVSSAYVIHTALHPGEKTDIFLYKMAAVMKSKHHNPSL